MKTGSEKPGGRAFRRAREPLRSPIAGPRLRFSAGAVGARVAPKGAPPRLLAAPLLVIGLDGATLDLVRPWVAAGELPALGGLLERGAWGRLRSTVPAATFPAWTSLVTGVNPGRHGVLDFTERLPGTYRIRFVNGSWRRVPALWTRLCAAGGRVAVLTVPATYPPEPIDGVMVSGFDTPLTTAIDGSFVHPRQFHSDIKRLVGRVPFADFQEVATGPGWHEHALDRLLDGIERRATLAEALLRRERWDALMVVFHSVSTTYLSDERYAKLVAILERAGREAPLAWVSFEGPRHDPDYGGVALSVTRWPGGETRQLAKVDFHAAWLEWIGGN